MNLLTVCLIICLLTLIGYIWGKYSLGTVACMSMLLFLISGCISPSEALANIGNSNVVIHFPPMDRIIGMTDFIETQIGGWAGCKNEDGSFDAEIQIIIASTIANGYNKLAARGY